MTFDWSRGALATGLGHYNAGEFFAAHEAWESVWLTAPQPEKMFLQALIQVTVALHHLQRSNSLGATRLLTAALGKLEPYPTGFGGISTTLLCDDIRDCIAFLSGDEPVSQLTPPRIESLAG
jgi:predicted metal-dependent hydrolase